MMRVTAHLVGIALVCACGCAPQSTTGVWGRNATLKPGWKHARQAVIDAASDAETWGTLAGAVVLQLGGLDSEISDWAHERTPLWGSQATAARRSDQLLDASQVAYWITAMFTPSGDERRDWLTNKTKGIGLGMAAVGMNHETTELIKGTTDRRRPDRSDYRSLPSGHASQASVYASLAGRNCRSLKVSRETRVWLEVACNVLALGCGWSRVEAKKHYPSDVLVGFALGHFLAALINDAFLDGNGEGSHTLRVGLRGTDASLTANWLIE